MFVRGSEQAEFVSRLRGTSGDQVLVVPVDVGKRSSMALVADLHGEVVTEPFSFEMNRPGIAELLVTIARAEAAREAAVVRVGVEAAGHYHRPCSRPSGPRASRWWSSIPGRCTRPERRWASGA